MKASRRENPHETTWQRNEERNNPHWHTATDALHGARVILHLLRNDALLHDMRLGTDEPDEVAPPFSAFTVEGLHVAMDVCLHCAESELDMVAVRHGVKS